ncbi:MAG: hypothetical protein ACYC8T_16050 [Myxococcaceae bacterium]
MKALLRALALCLTLCGATSFAQSARQLNAQGFRLYKQGRFPEALELFKKAFDTDEGYALAHYNYAATLGVLRGQGKVCEYNAFKNIILLHLARSIELDPRRRERMKSDRDFLTVRDTVGYQKLSGRSPERPADVPVILEQVSWFGLAPGAYGPGAGLDFKPRGKLSGWRLQMGPGDDAPTKVPFTGRWSAKGAKVRLELDAPLDGKRTLEGTLDPAGKLLLPEPLGPQTDDPGECEA